ncbi:LuxR C-terminal-related transcriptional regulator [Paucibacter sp. TC2R-5]|uniref:LuxR C-terminal-related transcriptional regulator n=1 Tax=Paucibacter sp. TC2R-5 TaxID=2893555 RepID=UPI0021E4A4E4|nr:LuxR C-terminal-related transcriptional regulator [Paucibacter sp. TC2R-5]MCV2359334.1 LuxR C-terminal-related transcriptional regulator [Paucibacter sp. TC2R-5]
MKFAITEQELSLLEQSLESATRGARVQAQTELAWHLRQRDSLRAMSLIAEAERRLRSHPLDAAVSSALTARLCLAASEISALFSRLSEAEGLLARAREHLTPAIDPDAEGDALLIEASVAKAASLRERELRALEQARDFFAQGQDAQRSGIAQGLLRCETSVSTAQADTAQADLLRAASTLAADAACQALDLVAQALPLCLREPAEAAALFARAAPMAQDMGLLRLACVVKMNEGNAWLELGELDQATTCFEAAAEMARHSRWPVLVGTSQIQIGRVLRHLGRFEESRAVLSDALTMLRVAPAGGASAFACSEMALTLAGLDRPLEAIDVMAEAIRLHREAKSNANLAKLLARQGRALAEAGRVGEAIAAIEEAQGLIERYGYAAVAIDVSEALAEVHRHRKLPEPTGMTAPTATVHFAQTALDRGMGLQGWRPPSALLAFIADAWAEADHMAQAYSYSRMAHLAGAQNGMLHLKNPQAVLQLLGYVGAKNGPNAEPEQAALAELAQSGGAPDLMLPTPKEAAVLQLLARGYANRDIAQALGVSDETTKWHLKGLYKKLAVKSRREAVMRAHTLGLLTGQ